MLSQHSFRRDHNGVPITRPVRKLAFAEDSPEICIEKENWNHNNRKLRNLATKLADLLEQVAFMERWFLPRHLRALKDPRALALAHKNIDHTTDASIPNELEMLASMLDSAQQKWQDIYHLMSVVVLYTLKGVDDAFPTAISREPFYRPSSLIRLWTSESHSPYNHDLGFCCSGWTSSKPYTTIEDLLNEKILTTESLKNHCEKKPRPSAWISFSDDASWMLDYAQKRGLLWNSTCRVAIISMDRLERCNIPWGRSDELVVRTGGEIYSDKNPDGVRYAFARQILVYGCVPAHCLVANFTIQQFCGLCKERNIKGSKANVFVKPPHMLLQGDMGTISAAMGNVKI
ncbi:hypothetical protein RBB50_012450 [Rhinocladiella similis]